MTHIAKINHLKNEQESYAEGGSQPKPVKVGTGDHHNSPMSYESLTPFLELDEVLQDYVGRLRVKLGDFLIGVHLVGSIAVSDFVLISDIDFIAVTRGELSEAHRY